MAGWLFPILSNILQRKSSQPSQATQGEFGGAWLAPLIKQIAQQRLGQQGKMGAIGSGLWQQAEARGGMSQPPTQAGEQYPAGGYLPQEQTPINNIAAGGSLPFKDIAAGGYLPRQSPGADQQSFLDAYWEYLMKQWGVR